MNLTGNAPINSSGLQRRDRLAVEIPRPSTRSDHRQNATMFKDFVEIIKPRISTMVLLTVWAGSVASQSETVIPWSWLHAMIGTLLIAGSGSAMNQYLERYSDFMMPRTSRRPLPSGSLSPTAVVVFAAITLGIGTSYLLCTVHWTATMWCFGTWFLYVWVYTLSKPLTHWNTAIGAIPGAAPVIVGASANDGTIGPLSWVLFGILVLWQIPHFMAIAWKYRVDYAEGGLKMLTVTDPSGKQAGWVAVVCSIALIAVGMIGVLWVSQVVVYCVITILAGGAYLWFSIRFLNDRNAATSSHLLRFSLLHLPVQMIALISCM